MAPIFLLLVLFSFSSIAVSIKELLTNSSIGPVIETKTSPMAEHINWISTEDVGMCAPYSAINGLVVPCAFVVCGSATITASTCPEFGGSFIGDTILRIRHDDVIAASNDDYGGSRCSYVTSSTYSRSLLCTRVSFDQTCYGSNSCQGTTYYTVSLSQGAYVMDASVSPASIPTQSPVQLNTASPTQRPVQLYTAFVGSFAVNSGYSNDQRVSISCQQACAIKFGGQSSDYQGSISPNYVTRTCNYYRSHSTATYWDSYSQCTSSLIGCYTALINSMNPSTLNYCFTIKARSPSPSNSPTSTVVPTSAPTSIQRCTPFNNPSSEIMCSFTKCGSFSISASTCPQFGGLYTGDTFLSLYDSSQRLITSNDDYGGSRCSYIPPTIVVGTDSRTCPTYYIAQRCYSSHSCTGTTAYFIETSASPTTYPTAAPTRIVQTVYADEVLINSSTTQLPAIQPQSLWVYSDYFVMVGDKRGYVWDLTASNPVALARPENGTEAVYGITGDRYGNIYFTQYNQCVIKRILASDHSISVVAGQSQVCTQMVSSNRPASQTTLSYPWAIQSRIHWNGYFLQLCFSEHQGNMLRCFDVANDGVVEAVAGMQGTSGYNGDDILATAAKLGAFTSFCFDATSYDIYIADTENSRIRRINSATGYITSIGGTTTQNKYPFSVAMDRQGNLYNSFGGHTAQYVQKTLSPVTSNTLTTENIAGIGVRGNGPFGGLASECALDDDVIVVTDPYVDGTVYVVQPGQGNIVALVSFSETISGSSASPTRFPTVAPSVQSTTLQWSLSLVLQGSSSAYLTNNERQVIASTIASLLDIDAQYIRIDSVVLSASARRLQKDEGDKAIITKVAAEKSDVPTMGSVTPTQHTQVQSFDLDIRATLTIPLTDSFATYESEPASLALEFLNTLQGHINTGNFDTALHDTASNAGFDAATRPTSLLSVSVASITSYSVTAVTRAPTAFPTVRHSSSSSTSVSTPYWTWVIVAIGVALIASRALYRLCYQRLRLQQEAKSNQVAPAASAPMLFMDPASPIPQAYSANMITTASTVVPGMSSEAYPTATAIVVQPTSLASASVTSTGPMVYPTTTNFYSQPYQQPQAQQQSYQTYQPYQQPYQPYQRPYVPYQPQTQQHQIPGVTGSPPISAASIPYPTQQQQQQQQQLVPSDTSTT